MCPFQHSPSQEGERETSKKGSKQTGEACTGRWTEGSCLTVLENMNLSNICFGHVWGTAGVGTVVGGTSSHPGGGKWAFLEQ